MEGQESCRAHTMIYKNTTKLHDNEETLQPRRKTEGTPSKTVRIHIFVAKENAKNPVDGAYYILKQDRKIREVY